MPTGVSTFESQGAEMLLNHIARMCAEEHYMIDHPEIGHSTYDLLQRRLAGLLHLEAASCAQLPPETHVVGVLQR